MNGPCGTGFHAVAAVDTLHISGIFAGVHTHFAGFGAQTAVGADRKSVV